MYGISLDWERLKKTKLNTVQITSNRQAPSPARLSSQLRLAIEGRSGVHGM